MGINNIFTAEGLFVSGKTLIELYPQFADLAGMINLFSNAAFTFLPVLIGYSATKKFGGNPYLAAVLGMIMVHPDLMNAYSYGIGSGCSNLESDSVCPLKRSATRARCCRFW